MSSYTSEIAVGSAFIAALGVAAYMAIRASPARPDENPRLTTPKKQPKNKKSSLQGSIREKPPPPSPAPRIPKVAAPAPSIPGGFAPLDNDELSAASGSNAGSTRRKKKKPAKKNANTTSHNTAANIRAETETGAAATPSTQTQTQTHTDAQYLSPEYAVHKKPEGDDGPWTRVENRRKTLGNALESTSDAGVTTSVADEEGDEEGDEDEDEEAEAKGRIARKEKLTLAEQRLPPRPKTAVDDMLEGPKPVIARVLRVPQTYDRPAGTAEWGDYEDAEDVRGGDPDTDDGWSVVPEKARRSARVGGSGYASTSSNPVPVTAPRRPTSGSDSQSQSKNAKKNAKRKEAAKSVRAVAEAARQAALAKHKREQEAERIVEQFKTKSKISGGMSASLNDKGQLVWE